MRALPPILVVSIACVARGQCESVELVPSQSLAGFGDSAAIDGHVVVVGAKEHAVVFERTPAGWMEALVFHSPAGIFSSGLVTAIDGDRIALGDPFAGSDSQGRIYVLERGPGGWALRDELIYAPFPADLLGYDVALHGDFVAGGAWAGGSGPVWFFELSPGSGFVGETHYGHEFDFTGQFDRFGNAVAIDDEWFVVGDPGAGPSWTLAHGRVFVFRRVNEAWVPHQHFTASDVHADLRFGSSLALDENRLCVGVGPEAGTERVYLFEETGGVWSETAILTLPEQNSGSSPVPIVRAAGDRVLTNTVTQGAQEGAGWLFELSGASFELTSKFAPAAPPGSMHVSAHDLSDTAAVVTSWVYPAGGRAWVLEISSGRSQSYCTASPNSTGASCRITHEGSSSISGNDFNLAAEHAPPGQLGVFYYGSATSNLPFGNGTRCVDGAVFRLNPPTAMDATGRAERPLDFTAPPADAGPGAIEAGDTWYFQFWFRDPAAGGANFNLSDGYAIEFCP